MSIEQDDSAKDGAKYVRLGDFLTGDEINECIRLWRADREHFHRNVIAQVLAPAMEAINRKLKQENDARYLAYVIEFALMELHAS